MRRGPGGLPVELLQQLALGVAFILLLAAHGFAAAHPALSALLVFLFSLPYLLAAVATRRAHFLYATMLLGAVSYFLTCYTLGAPAAFFPILSVPLVFLLWFTGQHLKQTLPAELSAFPRTIFRAMNVTVGVFTAWALAGVPRQMEQPWLARYVAGATFLGYAALYLPHCIRGAPTLYIYVCSAFVLLGGMLLIAALLPAAFCWLPALAAAALLLLVGTRLHRARGYGWSRHFYLSAGVALCVSFVFAALQWPFLLYDLALASLVLWIGYGWLRGAVGEVRGATLAERGLAKCLFLGSMALSIPLVPLLFIFPIHGGVAAASLAYGLLFGWIAWDRRDEAGSRNAYLLAAALFLSAGLLGLGRLLPNGFATAWSLAVPWLLLGGAGLLAGWLVRAQLPSARRSVAEGAAFVAFFAWYVPLLAGQPGVALLSAHAGMVLPLALARRRGEGRFLHALGPGVAGALISALVLLFGLGAATWVLYVVAAAAAGAAFVWADARGRDVTRTALNLGWLVLSVAAVAVAAGGGVGPALYSVTAVGAVAALMAGWRRRQGGRNAWDTLVAAVAMLSAAAAVALGPLSGWGTAGAGACLLVLAAAYAAAWGLGLAVQHARAAAALFALGMLLVIFGLLPSLEARLAAGAGVVAVLFVLAAAVRERFPAVCRSWTMVGHLASMVLACAALVLAWPLVRPAAAWAMVPYVLIYGLMPGVRGQAGGRVGAICWLTLLALLSFSAYAGTPYRAHAAVLAALAVLWLALGYGARRGRGAAWSQPLFICSALLAAFCGAVSLFTPPADGSWQIFLVNGIVFASLFLILRHDVFAYLVTLSLVLLAYDWVKASTSRFTQAVLFYLVIATAVLGVFFLLPWLKRLAARLGVLPVFTIFTWRGAALTSVPVACGALVLLSAYSVKLTEHPKFCISCHYMGEYYESWQHSAHKNVACVECHYEPGIEAELQGKVAGMIQFVKYMSHAYDSKPHAMISNRSCMREGCHAGMDHDKESLLFRGKIRFRHDKHLSGHPRGKELNCVSCHGQVVEGQHISVAETTCLTCHFYGRGTKPVAAGNCQTCHLVPEGTVEFAGESFNHREFLDGKTSVRCVHCHSQITRGEGAVSRTRCQSCHLRRTPAIRDQEQFHLVHVSEGHFDCLQCHDEIRHGQGTMAHQLMTTAKCTTCHGDHRHSVQERIYAGTPIAGAQAEPDVMYKAGVACDGCHTDFRTVAIGGARYNRKLSGAKQCAECHADKEYGDMLAEWQSETKGRLATLQPALSKLEEACRTAPEPNGQARKLLAAARVRVESVAGDGSLGAHNYAYVSTLLDQAEEELKKCRELLATPPKPEELGQ